MIKKLIICLIEWCLRIAPDKGFFLALRVLWAKQRGAIIGKNFRLLHGYRIFGYHLIEVGDNSVIADHCYISLGPGDCKLRIGNDSNIGPETYIRNANHKFEDSHIPIAKQGHEAKDVTIGSDVWIGARCILLGGTKLGDHSVLAAGSVISFEVPTASIAAGNPARVIKKRST